MMNLMMLRYIISECSFGFNTQNCNNRLWESVKSEGEKRDSFEFWVLSFKLNDCLSQSTRRTRRKKELVLGWLKCEVLKGSHDTPKYSAFFHHL